jgi:hypothetical protein
MTPTSNLIKIQNYSNYKVNVANLSFTDKYTYRVEDTHERL